MNEVTRAVLNCFIFSMKRFYTHKKAQNTYERTKIKNVPKKHLRIKIVSYSLIHIFVLFLECLCAV